MNATGRSEAVDVLNNALNIAVAGVVCPIYILVMVVVFRLRHQMSASYSAFFVSAGVADVAYLMWYC